MLNIPKYAEAPLMSGMPYLSETCWLLPAGQGKSETSVVNRGRGGLCKNKHGQSSSLIVNQGISKTRCGWRNPWEGRWEIRHCSP